jgi:hypothetical protein
MTNRDVFINCPFSPDYRTFFHAIVFVVARSGFTPRCAWENDDGGEVRIEKICRIIAQCGYGVHDISLTEPDPETGLPRFNMALELGLFLGARNFGSRPVSQKKALIVDRERFRYQRFMSDISGQDIHSHGGAVGQLIQQVAIWLRDQARDSRVPGGTAIAAEFARFYEELPRIRAALRLESEELTFREFRGIALDWIVAESGLK